MCKRRRTWILLAALIGVALAVYFEPSHCVRGWLHGEAFFDGRPTSYWRLELERWDAYEEPHPRRLGRIRYLFNRKPTKFEETFEKWMNRNPPRDPIEDALANEKALLPGPRLIDGDAESLPVLRALCNDSSPGIQRLVEIGFERCEDRSGETVPRVAP